jgi:hypothetical protein
MHHAQALGLCLIDPHRDEPEDFTDQNDRTFALGDASIIQPVPVFEAQCWKRKCPKTE